jgi:hypothetical protein
MYQQQQLDALKRQADLLNLQIQQLAQATPQYQPTYQQPAPVVPPTQTAPQPTQVVPVQQDLHTQLMTQINNFAASILTADQVKWLSDPTIMGGLPLFLKSEKGKQAVQLLFEEYASYVNR